MTNATDRSFPSALPRRRFLARAALAAACGAVTEAVSPLAEAADPTSQRAASAGSAALKMVDSHVHFYDPTRPEGVPWPPKNEAVLYQIGRAHV